MQEYHYRSPHQMHPLLPGEKAMEEVHPLAAQVINNAKEAGGTRPSLIIVSLPVSRLVARS
jgi:hypothetical protein